MTTDTGRLAAFKAKRKSEQDAKQLEADRKSGRATALTMEASMRRIITAKFGAPHLRQRRMTQEHAASFQT